MALGMEVRKGLDMAFLHMAQGIPFVFQLDMDRKMHRRLCHGYIPSRILPSQSVEQARQRFLVVFSLKTPLG